MFLDRQIEKSNMDRHMDIKSVQDFKSVKVEQHCISACAASLSLATRQRRNFIELFYFIIYVKVYYL